MAYRSKLTRLFALIVILGFMAASTYAQDAAAGNAGDADAGVLDEDGPPDKDPKEIDDEERIRRNRQLTKADRLITDANASYEAKDYIDAIDKYTQAEKILRDVSLSTKTVLDRLGALRKTLGRVYHDYAKRLIEVAREEIDVAKFDQAETNIAKAVEFDPSLKPESQFLQKVIEQQREQAEIDRATMAENIDPEYRTRLKEILIKKAEAKVFQQHRVFKRARNAYEDILLKDPANQDAVIGLRRLYEELREAAKLRRRAQEAERMAEIEWKWIDPIAPREIRTASSGVAEAEVVDRPGGTRHDIHEKLDSIVITKISFEETPVSTVFEYLKNRSRVLDPDGIGVNFLPILHPDESRGSGGGGGQGATPDDPFAAGGDDPFAAEGDDIFGGGGDAGGSDPFGAPADGGGGAPAAGGAPAGEYREPVITMDFDNIPLGEAVRYICEQAGLRYKVEDYAVVILGENVERGNLELRFFPIDPRLFRQDAGEDQDEALDFQRFFEDKGVTFPVMDTGDKASISYDRGTSKLIVRNTPENLRLMERILREINLAIPQVTIESKFVEVRQSSLEELSFKWLFLGHRGGPKRYQAGNVDVDVEQGALQNTTRSMTDLLGTGLQEVFSLDTIIGASQFNTLIWFLNRKDGTDILSAPKVTVQSGEEAFISMIEERMFPESFEEGEFSTNNGVVNYTPPTPVFGEPRDDLGVTLTVTPQVAQDGISISLDLHPKVVQFLGYDTTFNSVSRIDGEDVENRFDTPIFEIREIRTKVTVWDGESVVLGGTITDELTKVEDKVPVLGDLPMIGRLFRSHGENSEKRNLLMFVSARIVDPSGIPRREHDIRGLPDFRR